ncbi:MAG: hypothetical protein CBC29_01105 [Methylococcaceae bacterium TMED69]|nr:MAG: hypothetical protein CBC29_01105 [Methylococcaceae bacterium TMED69]
MINSFFLDQISKFEYIFENGGPIMIVIFGLGLSIWFFLLSFLFQGPSGKICSPYNYGKPWDDVTKKITIANKKNIALVKILVSICPLVGLLGSTTGMVAVFRVIEIHGTDAPQVGLSLPRVVIPTLVSLMISISGLIGLKVIRPREIPKNRAN